MKPAKSFSLDVSLAQKRSQKFYRFVFSVCCCTCYDLVQNSWAVDFYIYVILVLCRPTF